ncbi:NAD(P)-dependent oxidoreductase [Mycobacterium sp. ACS4331]|uniref:NAD(P)-dependent oxidoreductase n=1 Tax=Mycobacterium sp. ACS4331 TaxID=1834121 RepID=UPI0008021588|nr:NAD(P)-dependent oxidoreductase [Mycobacterium sp. ACS4331]OBF13621.1 phosphoglycerate dehydrogenase [Mycobacterium sp. ACS4331]
MKILVPDTIELELEPIEDVVVVQYAVAEPIPDEHTDAQMLVVWGNPPAALAREAKRLHRLEFVQSLFAGPDSALAAGFAENVLIAGGQGLHDATVSEHALALILAAARQLSRTVRAQIGHRWAGELVGLQAFENQRAFTTLQDAHVAIWGFGGIARSLAPLLRMLGARVTGIARSARTEDGVDVVSTDRLAEVLPTADVLVMILPSTPETAHALGESELRLLSNHAWLVNVGRGITVDEAALVHALRDGRLAGAALDVAEVEPLPVDSDLWDLPNVIITPHIAGGRPRGASALITENAIAHMTGGVIRNLVPR